MNETKQKEKPRSLVTGLIKIFKQSDKWILKKDQDVNQKLTK